VKKVAVITDATSAGFFFPAWHRYYGEQFDPKSLHVVTYEGKKPLFAGFELGNLWEINATYDDTLRAGVISDLVGVLLRSHDVVLRCDVDEFLAPDPVRAPDLRAFIERNELPYVTAHGIDVVEMAEDAPLDKSKTLPDEQRCFGMRAAALSKTALTTVPMRWGEGFHGATVPPVFAGLYNLHMKFADIKSRIAWHEWMVEGIQPGTDAHRYFAVGDAYLSEVHQFLSSRPRQGDETEAAFDARFLDSVRLNEQNGIYQGEFIRQDFLVRLDRLIPGAGGNVLRLYEGVPLSEPPEGDGLVRQLEAPFEQAFNPPVFVCDLSGCDLAFTPPTTVHIHGSDLVRRENVLLFGPNNLVSQEGYWFCEAQRFRAQYLDFYQAPFFDVMFPGAKPALRRENGTTALLTEGIEQVETIDEPVFLATPLEPVTWGRWIVTVLPKIAQYRAYGAGRKFLCHVGNEWQRAFLRLFGVPEAAVMAHHPGRTYLCRDVMTVEYSNANMSISPWERANAFEAVALYRAAGRYPRKIFVSRLTRSKANPHYRAMQNEAELAAQLAERGFVAIEPEHHPLAVQIAMFAAAEEIVFLGGSGLYNAVFCAPGTSVITIESTNVYIGIHTTLLATLGLRYGVIFGEEDGNDPRASHRRWTLDLDRALPVIDAFFAGG
jgi:hypothetical protein